jgi:hypothetical protein
MGACRGRVACGAPACSKWSGGTVVTPAVLGRAPWQLDDLCPQGSGSAESSQNPPCHQGAGLPPGSRPYATQVSTTSANYAWQSRCPRGVRDGAEWQGGLDLAAAAIHGPRWAPPSGSDARASREPKRTVPSRPMQAPERRGITQPLSHESESARRLRPPPCRAWPSAGAGFLAELVEQRAVFEGRAAAISRCLEPTPHEAGALDQRVDLWQIALGDRA